LKQRSLYTVEVLSFTTQSGRERRSFGFGFTTEGIYVHIAGKGRRHAVVREVPKGRSGTPSPKVSLLISEHKDYLGGEIRAPQPGDFLIGYVSFKPEATGHNPSLIEWTHLGLWESAHEELEDLLEQVRA